MIAPVRPRPKFRAGQLVHHRRYGYRGVVLEVDQMCQAPVDWYQSNKTQPERLQPWYHVLVHGTSTSTYAAQDNLNLEERPGPIKHPWLKRFFEGFDGESYVRNEEEFVGWETED